LEPGDRIALPQLARKLGTSVTPVREACTQLSYSGLIGYEPNRGFAVPALSAEEARILYNTVFALESEAIRQAPPGIIDITRLRDLNQAFSFATSAEQRFRLDMAIHEGLTSYYQSTAVERILEDLKVRIYLYERAYLLQVDNAEVSAALHSKIIDAIANGDKSNAIKSLRKNWLNIEPILAAAGLNSQD